MENIKEQFARLYMELDLTDDQAAMIKKLQRDVDASLRQTTVIGSVCKCPICLEEMKGIELMHYKCKKCNEYFTN